MCMCLFACSSQKHEISVTVINENAPQCTNDLSDSFLNLEQSKYIGTTINVSKDKPYWGMLVNNTGNNTIQIDMGLGENIVLVEPSQSVWIFCDSFFNEGKYEIGFSSSNTLELNGLAEFWFTDNMSLILPTKE